jgi:hypothetical protein
VGDADFYLTVKDKWVLRAALPEVAVTVKP